MVKAGRKSELIVYYNSVNDRDAQIPFRLSNGNLEKMYVDELAAWTKKYHSLVVLLFLEYKKAVTY